MAAGATAFARFVAKDVRAGLAFADSLTRSVAAWIRAVLADLIAGISKTTRAARPAGIYIVVKESRLFSYLREVRGFIVTKEARSASVDNQPGQYIAVKEDRTTGVESE